MGQGKQLNVNLNMTADVSQAKKQLQDLQSTLQNLSKTGSLSSEMFGAKDLEQAKKSANDLSNALGKAFNQNTGKLDLSRFNSSLKKSKTSLTEIQANMRKLGPEGTQAFLKVGQALSNIETPAVRINKLFGQFGTALKNAARWQISSSVLHGFMGAIQSAYGYAQDLNESLTNIRIVTGQTTDQMAEFAAKANKAAQALSTTTTAYTDAALIFYQQGLDNKAVEERTNAVIKMAQVTGNSASEVSSYMTAIWNNFDNGSKSLEYYEDVIAKLGATTASSSAEISEGISKFASVAQTAGLSYEYATSALATVVAATRQSADTVGTAFKTLFARIQDLELGKTLDDGTSLGQYSEALAKIGVNIKDASGAMRSMDDILDDMGAKWKTLGQDTQTAVAQAVAGTRQYTQLVALMENWDQMKTNVSTAQNSEGAVQEQADIYAESWEASSKRVRAAMEELYADLIDDKFFIELNNGIAGLIKGVNGFIDAFGGIKPLLLSISGIFMQLFANRVPALFESIKSNIIALTPLGTMATRKINKEFQDITKEMASNKSNLDSERLAAKLAKQNSKYAEALALNKNLTAEQRKQAEDALNRKKTNDEIVVAMAKQLEKSELLAKIEQRRAVKQAKNSTVSESIDLSNVNTPNGEDVKKAKEYIKANEVREKDKHIGPKIQDAQKIVKEAEKYDNIIQQIAKSENISTEEAKKRFDEYKKQGNVVITTEQDLSKQVQANIDNYRLYENQRQQILLINESYDGSKKSIDGMVASYKDLVTELEEEKKELKANDNASEEEKQEIENRKKEIDKLIKKYNEYIATLNQAKGATANSPIDEAAVIDVIEDSQTTINTKADAAAGNVNNDQVISRIRQEAGERARLRRQVGENREELEKQEKQTLKFSQSITKFTGGLMSAVAGVQAVTNSVKVFGDETATTGQKLSAGISTLTGGFSALSGALSASSALFNPIIAGLTIGAIALAGLNHHLKITDNLVKAFTTTADEAKQKVEDLSKSYKELKEGAEKAQTTVNSLTSNLDEYDSLVSKLDECTKGTEDWKDALEKVKEKAQEIATEFPDLLSRENIYNADGTLNTEEFKKYLEEQQNAAATAQAASLQMQQAVKAAEAISAAENTYANDDKSIVKAVAFDALKIFGSMLLGDATFVPFGGIIAGVIASANTEEGVNTLTENENNNNIQRNKVNELKEKYLKSGDLSDISYEKLTQAMFGTETAFKDLNEEQRNTIISLRDSIKAYQEAQVSITNAAKTTVNSWIETQEDLKDIPDEERVLIQKDYENIYKDKQTDYYNKLADKDNPYLSRGDTEATEDIDYLKNYYANIYGKDNVRIYEGKLQFRENSDSNYESVTEEAMAALLATSHSIEMLGESAENATKFLNDIKTNGKDGAYELYSKLLTGKTNELSIADYQQIFGEEDTENKIAELSTAETDSETFKEFMKTMGLDSTDSNDIKKAKEFISLLANGFDIARNGIEAAADKTVSGVGKNYITQNGSGASEKVNTFIGGFIDNAVKQFGSEGGAQIADMFTTLSEDEREAFSNLSFTGTETIDEIKDKLNKAGITNITDNQLKIIKESIKKTGKETADSLLSSYQTVSSMMEKLEKGKTIKDDDFNKINWDQLGIDSSKYFITLEDGTHKLIKSAVEFEDTIKEATNKEFINNINSARNSRDTVNILKDKYKDREDTIETPLNVNVIYSTDSLTHGEKTTQNNILNDQLDLLKIVDEEKYNLYKDAKDNNVITQDILDDIAKTIKSAGNFEEIESKAENKIKSYAYSWASQFETADELEYAYDNLTDQDKDDYIKEAKADILNTFGLEAISAASSFDELDQAQEKFFKDGIIYNKDAVKIYGSTVESLTQSAISGAKTIEDLAQAVADGNARMEAAGVKNIDYSNTDYYYDALIAIGEGYDNCTDEVLRFQSALASGNEDTIAAAKSALEAEIRVNELAKTFDLSADDIKDQAKAFQNSNENLKDNAAAAQRMAVLNQSMNKGVSTLVDNWQDWVKILNEGDKTSMDYIDTLQSCKSAMKDLLGVVDEDFIPDDFFEMPGVLSLLEKASEGDVDAINQLGIELANASVKALELEKDITKTIDGQKINFSVEDFENNKNTVLNGILDMQQKLAEGSLSAGDAVTALGDDWISALNDMALATGMSVDEMNSILNEMGVEASVDVVEQKLKTKVPKYRTYTTEPQDGPNGTTYTDSYTETVGFEEVEGVVQVAQINAGDKVGTAPSVTYTGRSAPSDSAKAGGSSKSSSSKSNGKEAKKSDFKDNSEIERYHEINKVLDTISKNLTKLDKEKSRAFGKDKLTAMQQETAELKRQSKAIAEKIREAKEYLKQDKVKVQGYGATFDADGNISNYTQLMEGWIADYNNAKADYMVKYNSTTDETTRKALDESWEDYEDEYKKKIDAVKNYEDSVNQLQEAEANLQETLWKEYDNKVESIKLQLELKLEINNAQLEFLKYQFDKLGDSFDDSAEKLTNYLEQAKTIMKKANPTETAIKGILNTAFSKVDGKSAEELKAAGWENVPVLSEESRQGIISRFTSGTATEDDLNILGQLKLTQEDIDSLKEYASQALEDNKAITEAYTSAMELISSTADKFIEDMDKNITKLENMSKTLDSYKNIINLIGKKNIDPTGYLTKSITQQQINLSRSAARTAKKELDQIDKQLSKTQSIRDKKARNGASEKELKDWDDKIAKLQDKRDAANQNWLDKWTNTFEMVAQKFDNSITQALDDFGESVAGAAGSLANLQESYEMKSNLASDYLQDYDKIYQLSKTIRSITKSISESTDARNNKRLSALQDEINKKLESGEKISAYTAENYQRQYELLLAQQQLEDAKNNKTNLTLMRDSQGNYSYQYTADDSKLADAQQNYEDKLYAIQQANEAYQNEMQQNMMNLNTWYENYVSSLDKTDEHYQEKLDAATKYYNQQMEFYGSELGIVLDNNKSLYNNEWTTYSQMTGYKISADKDYVDSFNETVLAQTTGFATLDDYIGANKTAAENLAGAAKIAYGNYKKDVGDNLDIAGTSFESFGGLVGSVMSDIASYIAQVMSDVDSLVSKFSGAFTEILSKASDFSSNYYGPMQSIMQANEDLYCTIWDLISIYSEWDAQTIPDKSTNYTITYKIQTSNEQAIDALISRVKASYDLNVNVKVNNGVTGYQVNWDRGTNINALQRFNFGQDTGQSWTWSNNVITTDMAGSRQFATQAEAQAWINQIFGKNNGQVKISTFDTGGYTGDWNTSDGKLAMLHEKELVLNKDDTNNMLQIVDAVRALDSSGVLEVYRQYSEKLSNLSTSYNSITNGGNNMEQTVTINADFPAVQSADEIKQAFNNLINMATQRAASFRK